MNEKIRNFARESHLDVYGLGKDHAKWEAAIEKFAKLIIEECELALWSENCMVSDLAYDEYSSNCRKIKNIWR